MSQKRSRLLKKSFSEWSVVQNTSRTPRNRGQNTTKAGLLAPQQSSESGTKEFFKLERLPQPTPAAG